MSFVYYTMKNGDKRVVTFQGSNDLEFWGLKSGNFYRSGKASFLKKSIGVTSTSKKPSWANCESDGEVIGVNHGCN